MENAPAAPKNVRKTTQSPALQKRPPIHGKNEASNQKRGMKDTGKTPAAPKIPQREGEWRKNRKTWMHSRMAYVF